jgi:putative ABC transport system permease protein
VVIAIAAMASVATFSDRIEAALTRNAGALIAADLRLGSRVQLPERWQQQAEQAGLDTALVTRFNSVVLNGDSSQLSAIKAVQSDYPLRGQLLIADRPFGATRPVQNGPEPGTVWLEPRLANSLGLAQGDSLTLGYLELRVDAFLIDEPDRGGGLFNLSPRLMMAYADLASAGLLGEGSRARYQLLLSGEAQAVAAFRAQAEAASGQGLRVENVADEQQQVAAAMERGRSFLTLAALTAVLLSGIAVAIAALRFSQRHTDSVATMRCLGATRMEVLSVYALMLVMVGVAALLPGVALGYAVQAILAAVLSPLLAEGLPTAGAGGAITASGAGLLILLGFTLAALLRLHGVAPAQVFNRSFQRRGQSLWWLAYLLPVSLFCGFVLWMLDDARLAAYVLGGSAAAIAVLTVISTGLMLLLRRVTKGVGVAWRFGLANLFRNGAASVLQICAIGLGLTIILLLTLVRSQLFATWQASLDDSAPNYFLINIQDDQREDVRGRLAQATGLDSPVLFPMATGRLVGINGRMPAAEEFTDPRAARRLRGTVNLSWADTLTASNTLVEGEWWGEDTIGVSLAETWAEPLGLTVGDSMTFRVGSSELTVPVTSLRRVAWDSFNVNFFLVLHPSLFEEAPRTWLGSFYLPDGGQTLTPLLRDYPNINVIDVQAILKQVRQVIELVSLALNVVFVFTLAAGLAVLVAALQSSRDQRLYQTAMLKALGIDRSRLIWGLNAEFLAIGVLAGLVAAVAASTLAAVLATQVFDLAYRPSLGLLLMSVTTGVAVVFLASRLGMRRVLASPPGTLLREN